MASQKIEEYLVQSGQYARLTNHLRDRLEKSGWYANVNALTAREVSTKEDLNFTELSTQIESKAIAMVPEDIKVEMLQIIRQMVDDVVERS